MRYIVSLLALAVLTASEVMAQGLDTPPEDRMTAITLVGGGLLPNKSLSDGIKFGSSSTAGIVATTWPTPILGLRASVLRSKAETEMEAGASSVLQGQSPGIWLVTADVLVKPLELWSADGAISPYLFGGIGAKSYGLKRHVNPLRYTAGVGNFGGGVDFWFNERFGLKAESRYLLSSFSWLDYDDNQRDWLFTGGINIRL